MRLHRKCSERRTHFFHALAKHIVERCVNKDVGRINVGELEGVREDKSGQSKNWERHGNLNLHGWAFDRFTSVLKYKAKATGIEVVRISERDTSKTCCICGTTDESQRVERGLCVCEPCDAAFNLDISGAENIRVGFAEKEGNSGSASSLDANMSTGWLAQPAVSLHDLSSGFQPRNQVGDFRS